MEPGQPVHRRLRFGQLAELSMLDLRTYRSQQVATTDLGSVDDPGPTITGDAQMAWLKDGLVVPDAQWKLVGNPVMTAPVAFPRHLRWPGDPRVGPAPAGRRPLVVVRGRRPGRPLDGLVAAGAHHLAHAGVRGRPAARGPDTGRPERRGGPVLLDGAGGGPRRRGRPDALLAAPPGGYDGTARKEALVTVAQSRRSQSAQTAGSVVGGATR